MGRNFSGYRKKPDHFITNNNKSVKVIKGNNLFSRFSVIRRGNRIAQE
jgi:hypothetical protein